MNVRITPEFWSDPQIEELTAEQKLAALWVMTNSRTTLFGYVEISERRFEFETSTPYQALVSLCEAHPKGFIKTGKGIWVRKFISYQFGTGKKLIDNNFCKPLAKELREYSDHPVFSEVIAEYPELNEYFTASTTSQPEGLGKGLASPREEKRREVKRRVEQEEVSEKDSGASDFDRFWAAYPNKVGKGAALKAWDRTRKARPSIDVVFSALARCKESDQWTKDGGQFIPHPATWLNQLRFLDFEPTESQKNKKEAEPDGWRDALAELLPDFNAPQQWGSLPPTVRDGLIEAMENRKKSQEVAA
jgi:hypothetical protein